MYDHHLREINNRDNYGWLRNMVHSLIQQLMRQDPYYYRLHVTHRPDNAWRLVCYPYYTKYATPRDKTSFTHIDVKIPKLIKSNRGANMIQRSVLLDTERLQIARSSFQVCIIILTVRRSSHLDEGLRRVVLYSDLSYFSCLTSSAQIRLIYFYGSSCVGN